MYKLPYFTEKDHEKVITFMKENSFAIVTGFGHEYPVATQLPLNVEIRDGEKIFLTGHLMKNTDHHKAFEKNNHVSIIFTGPHCYISASWYDKTAGASTWNYITVHAKGKINFSDESGTYQAIRALTDKYEGTENPASFDKIEADYIQQHIEAIIGFEIEVTNLDNVFKLSQNHDEETRRKIIAQLNKREDDNSKMIAKEILSRLTN
jgi:transcriptional regulator